MNVIRPRDDADARRTDDPPRSFREHLVDLRRCLLRSFAAWLTASLLVAPVAPLILDLLMRPLRLAGFEPAELVRAQRLDAGFSVMFQIMIWGGIVISLPGLLYFVAQFVFPGLTRGERRAVRGALLAAGLLFAGGVAIGFESTLPLAVRALFEVNDWMGITIWPLALDDYISLIAKTLLAFGLAFQMPLALLALGWSGVLTAAALRARRRHAIVAIFVIAMILTPPDPVSQIVMAVPMCVMYEICILLIAARGRPA